MRGARPPGLGSGGLCTPQHRGCTLPPRTPTAPVGGRITRRGRRWRCGGASRGGATPLNYAARAGPPPSRCLSSRAEVEGLVLWVARRHGLGFLVGTQPGRRKPRRRAADVRARPSGRSGAFCAARAQRAPGFGRWAGRSQDRRAMGGHLAPREPTRLVPGGG